MFLKKQIYIYIYIKYLYICIYIIYKCIILIQHALPVITIMTSLAAGSLGSTDAWLHITGIEETKNCLSYHQNNENYKHERKMKMRPHETQSTQILTNIVYYSQT